MNEFGEQQNSKDYGKKVCDAIRKAIKNGDNLRFYYQAVMQDDDYVEVDRYEFLDRCDIDDDEHILEYLHGLPTHNGPSDNWSEDVGIRLVDEDGEPLIKEEQFEKNTKPK
jgi:hypothetical protein